MTRPAAVLDSAALPPSELVDAAERSGHHTMVARALVRNALLLAFLGDALFRDSPPIGVAVPLWVAVLALTVVSLVWRAERNLSGEARAWLIAALLFSGGLTWRDADTLQAANLLAVVASLAMVAVVLNQPSAALFAERLRDTASGVAGLTGRVIQGILPVVLGEAFPPQSRQRWRPTLRPAIRAVAIALPLLLVFGSLLVSADPIFASLVSLPAIDFGRVASHIVVIGFFAWVVTGWGRRALLDDPASVRPDSGRVPLTLDALDVTIALGTLNLLFFTFMLAQLGWLFGGEAFLRARTGLTVAVYARTGFYQLVWTALLVVPVLLLSRIALRPGADTARRHTALALPLLALVAAMMISAASRLRLYVHYYGLTTERFYPLVFMGWLGIVLIWLALTVLRGWGRPFVAGATISGLMTLAMLNLVNPEAIIARVNLERGLAPEPRERAVDLVYLSGLSGDAVPLAARAVLAPSRGREGTPLHDSEDRGRCYAARWLVAEWSPSGRRARLYERSSSWRRANVGELAGLRAVAALGPALREVQHTACAAEAAHRARDAARHAAQSAVGGVQR